MHILNLILRKTSYDTNISNTNYPIGKRKEKLKQYIQSKIFFDTTQIIGLCLIASNSLF